MRSSRLPHLLRGLTAAGVATFTALLMHVAAGGVLPGWIGIAVPLLLSSTVSVLLAGRRLSLLRLATSVAISQWLFHALFVLGSIAPVGATPGHAHHGAALVLPASDPLGIVQPDGAMWAAHALAAILTTAALHRGELLLRRMLQLADHAACWFVALFTRAIAVAPADSRPRPPAPSGGADLEPTLRRIASRLRRRGPPLLSNL